MQSQKTDGKDARAGAVELGLLARVRPVPILPRGSSDLFRSLGDATLPFEEVASVLQQFPSIVARLLALVNSPWSSPVSKVDSLEAAVSRLGLGVVRSVSIALLVSSSFDIKRCASFSPRRYWCSALMAAETASTLAAAKDTRIGIDSAVARTAGLIANLGLLWLADSLPKETNQALSVAGNEPSVSVSEALLSECGINYCDAGAALSKFWNLPPLLDAAMTYRLPIEPGAAEKSCAQLMRLVSSMVADIYSNAEIRLEPPLIDELGVSWHLYEDVYESLELSLPQLRELSNTLFRGAPRPI